MADPIAKPRLPLIGNQDQDQIIDSHGNIYEFDLETNQWVYRGVIPDPDLATEKADGLVSPEIFRKLSLIQELMDQGFDFSKFKLDTEVDCPYYYYFHSSDDLIKFIPERITEPKEVRLVDRVLSLSEDGQNTLVGLTQNQSLSANQLKGLRVETQFGSHQILSNNSKTLTLSGTGLNLLTQDEIKIVKPQKIQNQLRIEIDRARLLQKLTRNCCVGPKGPTGIQGEPGRDGLPAEDEVFQIPTISGNQFSFDTTVATPIDTPISLRIFRSVESTSNIIEILFPIGSAEELSFIVNDQTVSIDSTSIQINYDPETEKFNGSFSVSGEISDLTSWRFKARQRGPKGRTGKPGKAFFEVSDALLGDPNLQSTSALVSMRKAAVSNDILTFQRELFNEIPASNLGALEGDSIGDLESVNFVGVRATIRDAKDIGFFRFSEPSFTVPPLDVPSWTPTRDCVQARRWHQYRFDWFNRVDPKYLFTILATPKPNEQCCQADFFYCPNVGDEPCGIQGEIEPPTVDIPCNECDCFSPISSDLGGDGLVLDPIDLLNPQFDDLQLDSSRRAGDNDIPVISGGSGLPSESVVAAGINSRQGVIDGISNTFIQEIQLCGNGEIRITVEFDSSVCGGEVKERTGCAFIDADAVRTLFVLEDLNGVSTISNNGRIEAQVLPVTAVFTVSTLEQASTSSTPTTEPGIIAIPSNETPNQASLARLRLTAIVNNGLLNLCRGYRISITALGDRTDCDQEQVFTLTTPDTLLDPESEAIIPEPEGSEVITSTTEDVDETEFIPESSFAPSASIIRLPESELAVEEEEPVGEVGVGSPEEEDDEEDIESGTTVSSFSMDDNTASAAGVTLTVAFETSVIIPTDALFRLVFPAEYTGLLAGDIIVAPPVDGSFDGTLFVGTTASNARSGDGTATPPGSQSLTFGPFTNPVAGTYNIVLDIIQVPTVLESFSGDITII